MKRFRDVFPRDKALIAMAHLPPLPGTPLYDENAGMDGAIEAIRRDLDILLSADFDAVMFCNEGDRPYVLDAGYAGVAALTRVVTELVPRHIRFGVDVHLTGPLSLVMSHDHSSLGFSASSSGRR